MGLIGLDGRSTFTTARKPEYAYLLKQIFDEAIASPYFADVASLTGSYAYAG